MKRTVILNAIGLILLAALAMVFLWSRKAAQVSEIESGYYAHLLPKGKEAFDFALTDQDGKPFRLHQLRGKLVLMTFGFTHCPNVCPTTLAHLSGIYRALPEAAQARTQIVFITADPGRDTPEVMKDYVPFFDKSFIGLTGNDAQITQTTKAYGAVVEKHSIQSAIAANYYTVDHSDYIYIIGPDGKWIGLYHSDQLSDKGDIVKDVQQFLGHAG